MLLSKLLSADFPLYFEYIECPKDGLKMNRSNTNDKGYTRLFTLGNVFVCAPVVFKQQIIIVCGYLNRLISPLNQVWYPIKFIYLNIAIP